MSEPTFTVRLTIEERNRLIYGLGIFTAEAIRGAGFKSAQPLLDLASRLCRLELDPPTPTGAEPDPSKETVSEFWRRTGRLP